MRDRVFRRIIYILITIFVFLILLTGFLYSGQAERIFEKDSPQFNPFEASVTVAGNNPPNIIDYYPLGLDFNALGDESLYFNMSYEDPDGTIPDAFWYVDDNLVQQTVGSLFDEFNFEFGCGISGDRSVKGEVSDGFLNDSVEWTVTVELVDCSDDGNGDDGGDGGDGDGSSNEANFSISRESIETQIVRGGTDRESILISNIGDLTLSFDLSLVGIEEFASLNVNSFSLSPGDSKLIDIDFVIAGGTDVGIYTGSVVVTGGQILKTVNLVLEIVEEDSLFDLESELKDDTLTKKQKLESVIKMTSVGSLDNVDVLLEYFIKDFEDNETEIGDENLTVDGVLEIERAFDIPQDLEFGDYLFYVKLSFQGNIATSSNTFKLIDVTLLFRILLLLLFLLAIIILLFLIFYAKKDDDEEKKVVLGKNYEKENKQRILSRYVGKWIGN